MNDRTIKIATDFKPTMALVIYESSNSDYYIESHSIDKNGQLLEGKPLLHDTIDEMVGCFFEDIQSKNNISGFLPQNLLAFSILPGGNYKMTWYEPAMVKQLFFAESLHIKSGKAWVPAMIYTVERNSLKVFALKDDNRPDEKTVLYKAPFHNIYSDGRVCLGSASVKKPTDKTYQAYMKYWEDLFWLSEFSHLNGEKNPTKTNLNVLWKKLINSKETIKWADLDELIAFKNSINLKSLI